MFPAIVAMIGTLACALVFTAQYWLWKGYTETSQEQRLKNQDGQSHLDTIRSADENGGPLFSDGMGNQENAA